MLINGHTTSVFPIPMMMRYLAGVVHWPVPFYIKLLIYAIWIPLIPILTVLFGMQAIVSGRAIREEAKKHFRWRLEPEGQFVPRDAIAIVNDVMRCADGRAEIGFVMSDDEEEFDKKSEEIKPIRKDITLDNFLKLDIRDEQNFRDVRYCISA